MIKYFSKLTCFVVKQILKLNLTHFALKASCLSLGHTHVSIVTIGYFKKMNWNNKFFKLTVQ